MKHKKSVLLTILLSGCIAGMAQTENPRGIYKIMTVDGKMGLVNAPYDTYKILSLWLVA